MKRLVRRDCHPLRRQWGLGQAGLSSATPTVTSPVLVQMRRPRARVAAFWLTTLLFPLAASASAVAQPPAPSGPEYADPGAAALHAIAMSHHAESLDRLRAYEATVRQRIGVALRSPLKDRTVYRAESAHRVFWRKGEPASIEVLGVREQTPGGVEIENVDLGLVDHVFEPDHDRLLLGRAEIESGSDPDDFRIEHPLEPGGAGHYTFASGDTVVLALPDGTRVAAVELRLSPLVREPSSIAGSLWIDPESGALVRALYRLSETMDLLRDIEDLREEEARGEFRWVPGILKPWTFELSIISVEYALWDGMVWLPRRWRGEGQAVAGILKIPAEFDRSYSFERVATDMDTDQASHEVGAAPTTWDADVGNESRSVIQQRRRHGRELHFVIPEDVAALTESPELPPRVWEDAPGFITGDEIDAQIGHLDGIPTGSPGATPWWFRWGLQRPDLVRYNRVEEFSVGARAAVLPDLFGRPLSVTGTVRIGTGDLHPNARLDVERNTLRRSIALAAYHELAATDQEARHLGLGNSLLAAFAGRDDGDYYRRSGASLAWSSPPTARASFRVAIHSEYHQAATVETRVALPRLWKEDAWRFRPNVSAEEGWEHALEVRLAPSWGTDPTEMQAGLEMTGAVAFGALEHRRGSLAGRLVLPLPADWRLALAAGGGLASEGVPPQRAFAAGGPGNLRGYAPRVLVGPCAANSRIKVQRSFSFGGVAAFSDAAWAGPCAALRPSAAFRSVGLGLSVMDGLIRFDLARGLDGPRATRLDVYLDGLL